MKLAQFTIAAMCVGLTLTACEKDSQKTSQKSKNNIQLRDGKDRSITNEFKKFRERITQRVQFDPARDFEFTNVDGVRVMIRKNSLRHADGSLPAGMVTLSIMSINSTAENVLANMPTQALSTQGQQGAFLQTGGSVEIKIFDAEGQALSSEGEGVTVEFPADAQQGSDGSVDEEMTLWDGVDSPTQPGDNVWDENTDPVTPSADGEKYVFVWEQNGMINIDKLKECPNPRTDYEVYVSGSGVGPFVHSNTQVFAVTQPCNTSGPVPNVVFALDMYNPASPYWFGNPSLDLSVGSNVTFVAVSSVGGTLYYGFSNVTISAGTPINITNMSATTMPALMAYLASL